MALEYEIEEKSKVIFSDSYSMSIGELINIYRDGELELHPEFQRQFRWTDFQKTRLIESLMLGIPIPPIFVVQRKDGVWDVIDGLQRLSTILTFVEELKDDKAEKLSPLILQGTKFLPAFEHKSWNGEDENEFDSSLKIKFKRTKITINIIKSESDTDVKYELFQRLNTGGTSLSSQEIRNCLLIMENAKWFDFIKGLSENSNFQEVICLTDRQLEEKYDMELVCRYLVGKFTVEDDYRKLSDINDFINEKIISLIKSDDFNEAEEKLIFEKVFSLLSSLSLDRPFAKYDEVTKKFKGMFLVSAFETIAVGLACNCKLYNSGDTSIIEEKIKKIWSLTDFIDSSGSGSSAKTRMGKTITIGKNHFSQK